MTALMENPEIIIYLLVGVALGGVIGWLIGSRKGAEAEAEYMPYGLPHENTIRLSVSGFM